MNQKFYLVIHSVDNKMGIMVNAIVKLSKNVSFFLFSDFRSIGRAPAM